MLPVPRPPPSPLPHARRSPSPPSRWFRGAGRRAPAATPPYSRSFDLFTPPGKKGPRGPNT
eukprot:393602-Prymnesium_polylepis.1